MRPNSRHELVHAFHIDSGLHYPGKTYARTDHKKYAECMSEMGVYSWSEYMRATNQQVTG